jgi:hypothetical protein
MGSDYKVMLNAYYLYLTLIFDLAFISDDRSDSSLWQTLGSEVGSLE